MIDWVCFGANLCAFGHASLTEIVVHAQTTFWWSSIYYICVICRVTQTVNSGFSRLGGDGCRELSWCRRSIAWRRCDVGMISVMTDVTVLQWFMDYRSRHQCSVTWNESFFVVELSCPDVVVMRTMCVSSHRVFRQNGRIGFVTLWLPSWMNSISSVKLCVLYSRCISRLLESGVDVALRDCELFAEKLSFCVL